MSDKSNPILDYADFLLRHKDTHCCDKLYKAYFGVDGNGGLAQIARGENDKYYLDEKAAEKVITFICGEIPDNKTFQKWLKLVPSTYTSNADKCKYLERIKGYKLGFIRQSKGEWADLPLILEPFQRSIIYAMYGIKSRETNKRRFKETWIEIGRKNGKTTLQAALALYALFEESGAEIYIAANTLAQSKRMWDQIKDMVNRSPQLKKVLKSHVNPRPEIWYDRRASKIVAVSGDASNLDGLNSNFVVIDEAHELPDDNYNILKQATANSRQPMTVIITTAGERRGALFDNKYEYYTKVLNGIFEDDSVLILIYELDDKNEIWQESHWYKANPSLEVMKTKDYLRDVVNQAQGDKSHVALVKTLTKDFNIIGVKVNAWLDAETINNGAYACYDPALIDDPVRCKEWLDGFKDTICLGGFDLSSKGDLTAFVILLFDPENKCVIVKPMHWCSAEFTKSARAQSSQVPWEAWIDAGYLRVSEEEINDDDVLEWFMGEVNENRYSFEKIGYDFWHARGLRQKLTAEGFSDKNCLVQVRQYYSHLSQPMELMRVLLQSKRLCYLNNPLFKWELSNVALVEDRNGNWMPRQNSENRDQKIDGVSATLNALYSLVENQDVFFEANASILKRKKK